MKVGDLEILQILDGEWTTPVAPGLPSMTDEEREVHSKYVLPGGKMMAQLGAFLVRTGNQVVLIDAGLGPNVQACAQGSCGHSEHQVAGPAFVAAEFEEFYRSKGTSEAQIAWLLNMLNVQVLEYGWLADSLATAGVRPEEITDVVLSHLHPDHMGWVARDGQPFFPKAKLWAHQADVDFFLSDTAPDETTFKFMLGVESTKERMTPVHAQIQTWDRDRTIAPGIDLRHLPGHTPRQQHCRHIVGRGARHDPGRRNPLPDGTGRQRLRYHGGYRWGDGQEIQGNPAQGTGGNDDTRFILAFPRPGIRAAAERRRQTLLGLGLIARPAPAGAWPQQRNTGLQPDRTFGPAFSTRRGGGIRHLGPDNSGHERPGIWRPF